MMASDRGRALARTGLAALILLWAGVLIGVSFLAASVKFQAPSLGLPVAMDVGRQELGLLDRVELGFATLALVRAELLIQGQTPPAAPWHALYVVVEVLKLLALPIAGWLALWRARSA